MTSIILNITMRDALLAARQRLGDTDDSRIGTAANKGRTDIVRTEFIKRKCVVTTLRAGLTDHEAIAYLMSLEKVVAA